MPTQTFNGLRVLTFESRRSTEMATLITTYGGTPVVAPALREVPLETNTAALDFAARLMGGEFDVVILLTGVGTRVLLDVVERVHSRDAFVAALARTRVLPRGPKPMAVLRELGVPAWATVPEPNTWRELLAVLDDRAASVSLRGARVAVQEYGVTNTELIEGLKARGATVTAVPVYRWALPEDVEPLKAAVKAIVDGHIDVALFTTATQLVHLLKVARDMNRDEAVRRGFQRVVVASIGPTTSEELRRERLEPDLEPTHPKMGFLVKEAAERAAGLLRTKRGNGA